MMKTLIGILLVLCLLLMVIPASSHAKEDEFLIKAPDRLSSGGILTNKYITNNYGGFNDIFFPHAIRFEVYEYTDDSYIVCNIFNSIADAQEDFKNTDNIKPLKYNIHWCESSNRWKVSVFTLFPCDNYPYIIVVNTKSGKEYERIARLNALHIAEMVRSLNPEMVPRANTVLITVKPEIPPKALNVTISANPSSISSISTILSITVTSDGKPVEGAHVDLIEGMFVPVVPLYQGITNSDGIFTLNWYPSGNLIKSKDIRITARASKPGYVSDGNTVVVTVNPSTSLLLELFHIYENNFKSLFSPPPSLPFNNFHSFSISTRDKLCCATTFYILILLLIDMVLKRKYLEKSKKRSPRVIVVHGTIVIFILAFVFGVISWSVGHYADRPTTTAHTFGDFIWGFLGFLIVASFAFYQYAWLYKKAWNEKQKVYWKSPGGITVIGSIIISILAIIFGFFGHDYEPWGVMILSWFLAIIVYGGWIFYLCVGIYLTLHPITESLKSLKEAEEYHDTTGDVARINILKIAKDHEIKNPIKVLKAIERDISQKYLRGWIDYRTLDYVYMPTRKIEDKDLKYILTIDKREKIYESLFYDPKIAPFRQEQTVNEYIINNVRDTLFKFIISANARSRGLDDDTQMFDINTIYDLGKNMRLYFSKEMLDSLFNETCGYLQINTTLLSVPWEMVRYNKEFLFEKHSSYRTFPTHKRIEAKTDLTYPIKCLYISDPTKSLKHESVERSYMEDVIKQMPELKEKIKLDVIDDMTADDFKYILIKGKYDIIHYTGHGAYKEHLKEPVIYFKDSTLRPSDIPDIKNPPKLIIFNACITAEEKDIEFYAEIPRGFAQVFIEKRANSFIGTLWPIRDYAAGKFAREFYKDLFINNFNIAYSLMRIKKEYCNDPDFFDIIGYVLYSPNPTWSLGGRKKS